ncbi:transmembrane protein 45B-like isoform X1 [Watersipora subatra]|uniref:transmembrane protein 45B-like isoform X1 n=1 Tax=Watersipora subatra TaxID=2589382 RepID=UPI00355AD72C
MATMEGNHSEEMHVGSFSGHVVPGSMFAITGFLNSIQIYHHYFLARKNQDRYRATHARPLWCFHGGKTRLKQIEAICRFVLVLIGIIGELATSYNSTTKQWTNKMMHAEHITMFAGFGISALVDIFSYDNTLGCLPEGSDYFCGLGAVMIEFVLFLYHLHGRNPLNTHLHIILIYTIGFMAITTVTECIYRDKVIWSIARVYSIWLQGTWFWQIAFILFNPANNSKSTLDTEDPESIMIATLYLAGHIILGFAVQFVIGFLVYVCHGRPSTQSRNYVKLSDGAMGNSSTASSSTTSTNRNDSDIEETNLLEMA